MRSVAVVAVVAVALGASASANASLVPRAAEREISETVPRQFAYVPARAPHGWHYHSWDAGRETPGLFPRGRGLNVWFSTPYPNQFCPSCTNRNAYGAGFHVYADSRCSIRDGTETFDVGKSRVAWSATYEDALAWRCVRVRNVLVRISVSFSGTASTGQRFAARRAAAVARMVASAHQIRLH